MMKALLLQVLLSLCLVNTASADGAEHRLSYCLGEADLTARYKYAVADATSKMKEMQAYTQQMRKLAENDQRDADRLRALLKSKHGVLPDGTLTSDNKPFYERAFDRSKACFASQVKPCTQSCFKTQDFPDASKDWECQQVCHEETTCKPDFDCSGLGKQS